MAFTPNFVFADAVPAQQAVQYAQIAAQQQAQQDQAFNERFRNATQGSIARENAGQQRMLSQSQMQQQADERQKDRMSNQTIAGIQAGRVGAGGTFDERVRAQQASDAMAKQDDSNQKYETGRGFAMILNNPRVPEIEKAKVRETALKSGLLTVNKQGFYVPLFPPPPPIALPGQPSESINDIKARFQPVEGISGTGIPGAMDMMPSRSRMLQMGSPPADFPSASVGPSPFETPGFQVFRQSDFTNPSPMPAYDASGNEFQYRGPAPWDSSGSVQNLPVRYPDNNQYSREYLTQPY